jgi:hypothetical protein
MASESQTVVSPSFSTGTLPLGEPAARASAVVRSVRRRIGVSVNGAPVCLNASHARSDQVDQSLSPISSSMFAALPPPAASWRRPQMAL